MSASTLSAVVAGKISSKHSVNRRVARRALKHGTGFVWLAAAGRTPPGLSEANCGGDGVGPNESVANCEI